MDWLNLHTSTLDSAEFIGSEPTQRATWLCLQRFCIGQENAGRIVGCVDWTDRRWQQLCRITRREVLDACPLWVWEGNDLIVWSYPIEKELEVRANRVNGGKGGRPTKPKETDPQTESKPPGLVLFADQENQVVQNRRNGKERKGKERNNNTARKRVGFGLGSCPAEQSEPVRTRMLAINALKHRQPGTFWTPKEFEAFQAGGLDKLPDADFAAQIEPLTSYYAADAAALRELWRATDPRADFRRRDLLTLLHNWAGEVDRAREWCHWQEKKAEGLAAGRL